MFYQKIMNQIQKYDFEQLMEYKKRISFITLIFKCTLNFTYSERNKYVYSYNIMGSSMNSTYLS